MIVKPISDRIPGFINDLQFADIADSKNRASAFSQLKLALQKARIGPAYFPWPPPSEPSRNLFRGLRALEEIDAAIFFGRDAAITRGLDALRRMRDGAHERILAILGASGAGKSSFLRAGLLARLERDTENFIVLPVVRPERAALSGPRGLLRAFGVPTRVSVKALVDRFATIREPVIAQFRQWATAAGETWSFRTPTLVVPIDQFEEFFYTEHAEAASALDFLAAAFAVDTNIIAVLTIRSDSFEQLQGAPHLAEIPRLLFDLPPLSPTGFKEVIEGPCRLAQPTIAVEPALTERLLNDLSSPSALPLLSFTLERLVQGYCTDGKLKLHDYVAGLKGLAGVIDDAVDATFDSARNDPSLPDTRLEVEALARETFIPWLVRVAGADSGYKRRIALVSELPVATRPLIAHFINQRLLVSDTRDVGGATVEVAHEAVLHEWPALSHWIEEEREFLLTKSMLERELLAYQCSKTEAREAFLLSGLQYDKALIVYNNRRKMLSDKESQYVEESQRFVEKKKSYELARSTALQKYVRPILETRLAKLELDVSKINKKINHSYRAVRIGFAEMMQLEAEGDHIKNFLTVAGRWHPSAAEHKQCLGAENDYAELYIFPCCGTHVVTDTYAPEQFRADGCEPPP